MPTETFDVTYSDIEAELGVTFETDGRPTQAQVTAWISRLAADVNKVLMAIGFTLAEVLANSAAKAWAQETLVLGVAAKAAAFSYNDALRELAASLRADYKDRLRDARSHPEDFAELWSASEDAGAMMVHDPSDYADDADVDFWTADKTTAF